MRTVRVFYKKLGRLKFISHLDMNRFMLRALRLSGLPVWYTEGFNPHPYATFAPVSYTHLDVYKRPGVYLGAKENTFAGLAGIGDLVVTCTSMHSRNRRFGILVGKGETPETALREVGTVEGYHAVKTAWELAKRQKVEMPITEQGYHVLYEHCPAREAIGHLMGRPGRMERDSSWLADRQ